MKTYSIIMPSLDGVLSDDELYFEGMRKPPELFAIRDGSSPEGQNIEILEKYFNDIYNLFIRKLSLFVSQEMENDEDSMKLQALLQEIVKVKGLITNASKVGDTKEVD